MRALARSLPALVFAGALAAFLAAMGGGFLETRPGELDACAPERT